jgi:sucrose-6-phosphate hydrolase SacC (GH32 family)
MEFPASSKLAPKSLRPVFHFTPETNWMNDPNGLIYYKGKYHLFFQHNPEGDQWGNMSWGHATSTDLINWNHLPVAISYSASHGIFSGSAVVDYFNTSGFGSLENPAMVAIFTDHNHDGTHQAQSLAYSVDEGLTWTKYSNNPVLDLSMKDFRDPKVSWNTTNEAWVMSVVKPQEFTVCFYQSHDLKTWTLLSEFSNINGTDGVWECPDLFPLAVDGDPTKIKWVLFISVNPGGITGGSGTHYFIGDWDGKEFTADDCTTRWLDYGRDNYAGVTWGDAPNGRCVYLGWMNNWEYAKEIPANPYRGSMTTPRELSLITVDMKPTLIQKPINEISSTPGALQKFTVIPNGTKSGIRLSDTENRSIELGYDSSTKSIYLDRSEMCSDGLVGDIQSAPFDCGNKAFEIEVVLDHCSIEVFVAGGQISLTALLAGSPAQLKATAF